MRKLLSTLFLVSSLVGCGAVDPIDTNPDTTEAALSPVSPGLGLPGAYVGKSGFLAALVLKSGLSGGTFFADQNVQCVTAPCDPVRISGTWSSTAHDLTLDMSNQKWVLSYALSPNGLVLASPTLGAAELTKVRTYCDAVEDCAGQPNLAPLCRYSEPVCTPNHTCSFICGVPKDPCATVLCPVNTHCVSDGGEAACVGGDECASDKDCDTGQHCQPDHVCFRAPCFTRMVCR